MKQGIFLLFGCLFFFTTYSQTTIKTSYALDENSVIRDSSGRRISKIEYYEAITSGNYQFKPIKDSNGKVIEFLLIRCDKKSNNTKVTVVSSSGCVPHSAIEVGQLAPDFDGRDINDSVFYDFNFLKGKKIIVLNFWFTKCEPCIRETQDLNNLYERYKNNPNIIFLAPTFEFKESIDRFLAIQPFKYTILPEAIEALKKYKVFSYPTNIIIDIEGRISFITVGGTPGIEFLMDKKIREALDKMASAPKKD